MVHVDHSRHPVYLSGRSTRGVSPTIANNCSLSKGNETGRRPYASHDTQQLKAAAIFFLPALYLTPHARDIHRSCSTNFEKPTPGPCLVHSRVYVPYIPRPGHVILFSTIQYAFRPFHRENPRLDYHKNKTLPPTCVSTLQ